MRAEGSSHNLPAPASSFIGREHELVEIQQRFPKHRLITLTGTGGTGKTRLALEAAASAIDQFVDGVWLVELAGLPTPDLMAQMIAKVFTLPPVAVLAPIEQLGAFLQPKQLLLVLDNCEHLIQEAAQIAAFLLAHCPRLTLLATSREPLAISGEVVLRVPPLSLPDSTLREDWTYVLHYSAPRLFVERAHAAEPSFQLTASNAQAVAEICRRLDGIPLALELAAGQVRGMGVTALTARLNQRFQLAIGGNRGALPRHQTLHAMIDWSYGRLSPPEQLVLRRLGIFAGDFVAQAAEWVCAGGTSDHDEPALIVADAVFNHLLQLVNKSLVQYNHETERYRLLETIRVFCLERLEEAGETPMMSAQHLAWYLRFADAAAPRLAGPEQAAWGARLEAEHDNLRTALSWAIDTNQAEQAADLALALWQFWHTHTYQREGLRWLERILALETAYRLPLQVRPQLFNALGVLAASIHSFDQATAYHAEALRLWRTEGDQVGIAQALHDIGLQQFNEMRPDQARQYATESLEIARGLENQPAIARAQALLALAVIEGDAEDHTSATRSATLAAAIAALEQSLAIYRALQDTGNTAKVMSLLARAEEIRGNYDRAKPFLRQAVRLLVQLGNYIDLEGSLVALLFMAMESPQQPEGARLAAQVCGMMAARLEKLGGSSPWAEGPFQQAMAQIAAMLGTDAYVQTFEHGKQMTSAELILLADEITDLAFQTTSPKPPHAALTVRELEVLRLVATGLTNAQVAQQLHVTPRTVNAHLTAIYSKLGVSSRGGAMRFALDHQLG